MTIRVPRRSDRVGGVFSARVAGRSRAVASSAGTEIFRWLGLIGDNRAVGVLETVTIGSLRLERFESVLAPERYEAVSLAVERGRRLLEGRVVWNVNSTARGGGVAEMLISLLAYAKGAGVDARWVVIPGTAPFFEVTKRIHNNLHSAPRGRRRARRSRA